MKKKILLASLVLMLLLPFCCSISNAGTEQLKGIEVTLPSNGYTYRTKTSTEIRLESNDKRNYIQIDVEADNSPTIYNEESLKEAIRYLENRVSRFSLIASSAFKIGQASAIEIKCSYLNSYGYTQYSDVIYIKSDNYDTYIEIVSLDRSFISGAIRNQVIGSLKIKDTVSNSNGLPFTDVSRGAWYRGAVEYVYNNGIVNGANAYTFNPEGKLTRAELVTMLHSMEGRPYVAGKSKFPDVQNTSAYYYVAVKWATQKGVVSGYNNGKFGPNDLVTREQLATILRNYAQAKGKYKAQANILNKFSDSGKISDWARYGMQWATGVGVVNGSNGKLNPSGSTTRAEAAAMLTNFCTKVK